MNINNLVALQTLLTSYCCPNITVSSREHPLVLLFFCISSSLIVVMLSCPLLLLEVFRFFFPLLLSTGICFTAVYQFLLSENHQGIIEAGIASFGDVSEDNDCQDIIIGEEAAAPQHYNRLRLRFFTEIGLVEIRRVPVESSTSCSKDGNNSLITVKVALMKEKERKAKERTDDDQEQEHITSWVDRFAEGVWNCYYDDQEIIS